MGYLGRVRPKSRWLVAVAVALIGAAAALSGLAVAEPLPPPTTVSLTTNATSVTVPAEIELTATTNQSMSNTGYGVVIYEVSDGDRQMAACGSGTICGASDWAIWAENENPQPHSFRVELRNPDGAVIASDSVTVDVVAAQWSIDLAANASSVTVPAEIKLEATANRSTSGTGYTIVLIDEDDNRQMNGWCSGAKCGASEWVTWAEDQNPQPHHYRAEVRHSASGAVVATDSVTVDVVPAEWSVDLKANAGEITIPAEIKVEATANRSLSGTGYSIAIFDERHARQMNGWCSGATCGASHWVTWDENPDPRPHAYRAEIRHGATGAVVATDTVEVDVSPFWFKASLVFSVVNGVNKATATATPSPNGSPYSILIKRLSDGRQMCQVWLNSYSSCQASVSVGETYRATVETGAGHVAGRSPWSTLTANGPQEEKVDDLDLIALAALYESPSAICTHVLLYPGTHFSGSSVSDQYLACEAAVQQGKSVLGVLRAIAAAGGGTAVLWYLHERVTEETTLHDPSDDEEVEEPTPVPPPISWPADIETDVDTLIAQNPELDRPTATTVAKQCRRLVLRAGLNPADCVNCRSSPRVISTFPSRPSTTASRSLCARSGYF